MHNHQLKKKKEGMLSFFRKVALVNNFSFTGQEILRDLVLALDGPKRKLLVVEEKNKNYDTRLIYLSDINASRVKKVYAAIDINGYKRNRPEEYLRSIALEFDLYTSPSPVVIPFYKSENNSVYEIKELEARARNWEMMLSKMLQNKKLPSIS